jgi:hypothetical protein
MSSSWKLDNGKRINLVTPAEFEKLPDGTKLISIDNKTFVKGADYIDNDTRFGHLAFGLSEADV